MIEIRSCPKCSYEQYMPFSAEYERGVFPRALQGYGWAVKPDRGPDHVGHTCPRCGYVQFIVCDDWEEPVDA